MRTYCRECEQLIWPCRCWRYGCGRKWLHFDTGSHRCHPGRPDSPEAAPRYPEDTPAADTGKAAAA